MKVKLNSVSERCNELMGTTSQLLVMGGGDTHRTHLKLPVQYKSNRDGKHKPIHLEAVREYLTDYHNAINIKHIEADDYIAMLGFKGWRDWKKTGEFSYVQVCEDKDAMQVNSLIYNPRKSGMEWIYDEPVLVDGLGELYRNEKGDVKGNGFAWLMYQMWADKTDGFCATTPFNIRWGAVGKYELLKDCITPTDYLQKNLDKYREFFGDRVQYEAWDGTEMDIPVSEYADMIFACAYMLRWKGDNTTFSSLCKKYGVV